MQIPVYEFLIDGNVVVGCGTQLEYDYWTAEGVFDGYALGKVLSYEPASEDDARKLAWGVAA